MPSVIEYALLAAHVYEVNYRITDGDPERINDNGQLIDPAANQNAEKILGWKYVGYDELSSQGIPFTELWDLTNASPDADGFFASAYEKGGELVVAFRGTQDAEDWVTNIASLGVGVLTDQFLYAHYFVEAAKQYAQDHNLTLSFTGHSLGGALASVFGAFEGVPTTVFNPAFGLTALASLVDGVRYSDPADVRALYEHYYGTPAIPAPSYYSYGDRPFAADGHDEFVVGGSPVNPIWVIELPETPDFDLTTADQFVTAYVTNGEALQVGGIGGDIGPQNVLNIGNLDLGLSKPVTLHGIDISTFLLSVENGGNFPLVDLVAELPGILEAMVHESRFWDDDTDDNFLGSTDSSEGINLLRELVREHIAANGGLSILSQLITDLQRLADVDALDDSLSTMFVELALQDAFRKLGYADNIGTPDATDNSDRVNDTELVQSAFGDDASVIEFDLSPLYDNQNITVPLRDDLNDALNANFEPTTLVGLIANGSTTGRGITLENGENEKNVLVGLTDDDRVSYADAGNGITLTFDEQQPNKLEATVATVTVNAAEDSTDYLLNVEWITGTDGDDRVVVNTKDLRQGDSFTKIDLGSEGENGDIVDLTAVQYGVYLPGGGTASNIVYSGNARFLGKPLFQYFNAEDVILTPHNDTVSGGGGHDGGIAQFHLGAGDDVAKHILPGTLIHTGSGSDKVYIGTNIAYADLDGNDELHVTKSFVLHGASGVGGGELPYIIGIGGVRYGYNTAGDIVISMMNGFETFLLGGNMDHTTPAADRAGGILAVTVEYTGARLFDPDLPTGWMSDLFLSMAVQLKTIMGTDFQAMGVDPLVVDLDGDGVELTAQTSYSPMFDMDGDGFLEHSGWVLPDDGLLVVDLNGNGIIDDISELFGGPNATGFEELAAYDADLNGVVNANDTNFADLMIWQDADMDGVTDAGELKTLAELGITSLSLTSSTAGTGTSQGNYIASTGTFTYSDGTTGGLADVNFRIDNYDSSWTGDSTVDPAVAGMANLHGRGTLTDLHIAMTNDLNLRNVVTTELPNLTSHILADLRTEVMPILAAWADADTLNYDDMMILTQVDQNGDTQVVDFMVHVDGYWGLASGDPILDENGQVIASPNYADVVAAMGQVEGMELVTLTGDMLAFLERYLGESLPLFDAELDDLSAVLDAFTNLYSFLLERLDVVAVRLALQGPMSDLLPGIYYDVAEDNFKPTTDAQLTPAFEALFASAPASATAALDYLGEWEGVLRVIIGDYDRGEDYLENTFSFLFTNIVAAYENVGLDATLEDTALAMGIPDGYLQIGTGDVQGHNDVDLFYVGGTGDDTYTGGGGADAYVVGRDFGNDTIVETEAALSAQYNDLLRFAHYNPEDLTMVRVGLDLVITVNGKTDSLTIKDQFSGPIPGLFGSDYSEDNGVAEIIFANGTTWDKLDIARAVSHPLDGDEYYDGTDAIDFLEGGAGDDTLNGGDNGDVYTFTIGSDNDVIYDDADNVLIDAPDWLLFGDGITVDDVTFGRSADRDDLIITINGTTDTLTIRDHFTTAFTGGAAPDSAYNIYEIELFSFTNGLLLESGDVMDIMLTPTDGDDYLIGFNRADVITGGAGDDTMIGTNGSDTYIFGRGDGNDVIHDELDNYLSGNLDRVKFGYGITLDDLTFSGDGANYNIKITINDTGDTLTIKDQGYAYYTGLFGIDGEHRIELFEFDDGTTMTWDQIRPLIFANEKTDGDDTIYGYFSKDTIEGGLGDDRLVGDGEGDTYIYNLGDGNDTIYDNMGLVLVDAPDRIKFGEGILAEDVRPIRDGENLVLRIEETGETITIEKYFNASSLGHQIYLIEEIHFADGTVWGYQDVTARMVTGTDGDDYLIGGFFHDYIDGGLGNDTLLGENDGDTYVFNIGYGQDIIQDNVESVFYDDPDIVELGEGITPDNVILTRVGENLKLEIEGVTDSLTINQYFNASTLGHQLHLVEELHFSDGTVWDYTGVIAQFIKATDGDDFLEGGFFKDTLDGGLGNDTLEGRNDGDTYIFDRGYGHDKVYDQFESAFYDDPDIVRFGATVAFDDVTAARVGDDLVFTITDTGETLTIVDQYNLYGARVEEFHFGDGTVKTADDYLTFTHVGTDGNDSIVGSDSNDSLVGGLGDDTLNGGAGSNNGNDTYHYTLGDGNDIIIDLSSVTSEADRLMLHGVTPTDLQLVRSTTDTDDLTIIMPDGGQIFIDEQFYANDKGIDLIGFDDGTFWTKADLRTLLIDAQQTNGNDNIQGFDANDTLEGGLGDDTLVGENYSDTYVFTAGDGQDRIEDNGGTGTDRILIHGYTPDQVILSVPAPGSDTLVISFDGSTDQITVTNTIVSGSDQIEQIVFDDGTVWSTADVRVKLFEDLATGGNDVIEGYSIDDTLSGGLGDDTLTGNRGSDTYVFNAGDGRDVIEENGYNSTDRVVIHGYTPEQVTVSLLNGTSDGLVLTFAGSDDRITIKNTLDGDAYDQVEQIVFDDGTVWSVPSITTNLMLGTAGNDVLNGTSVSEHMTGLGGNDQLNGGDGDDTLEGGTGDDTLSGGTGTDVFIGGDGIDTADFTYSSAAFTADLAAGTIDWGTATETMSGIENIVGSTGNNILVGDAGNNRLEGHDGDDSISGGSGDDFISGGTGLDTLDGGDGNDTVTYAYSTISTNIDLAAGTAGTETVTNFENAIGTQAGEQIAGTTGANRLDGQAGDDTLTGGLGADTLTGGLGDDTFRVAAGWGNDIITDFDATIEKIDVSGANLAYADLSISQVGADVLVSDGVGNSITLLNTDVAAVTEASFISLSNEPVVLTGTTGADVLTGNSGDDTITGDAGNDTLSGGNGNDRIDAGKGADLITGGGGNDVMFGGDESDTYVFTAGDGQDAIEENGFNDTDRIVIHGYAPTDLILGTTANGSNDLVITFQGSTDQITVYNTLDEDAYDRIEQIVFDDGTNWSAADIRANLFAQQATDGNDRLWGYKPGDVLEGGLGDDTLTGRDGSDTYVFNAGDGSDVIEDDGFNDTDRLVIHGYAPSDLILDTTTVGSNDLRITFQGSTDQIILNNSLDEDAYDRIEQIVFDDGTIWSSADIRANLFAQQSSDGDDTLWGFKPGDVLEGGLGNDFLSGRDGSDTYVFTAGDGQDIIEDNGFNDTDQLVIHGYAPADVTLSLLSGTADGLMLYFAGSDDSITIRNTLDGDAYDRVEQIVFDDGTVWSTSSLVVTDHIGSNGADVINGTSAANTIEGRAGDDTLTGGGGIDTFVFGDGWGQDLITDFTDGETLDLSSTSLTFADLTISQVGADVLVADGAGNQILLAGINASTITETDFTF